jgi:hypothetical protein
MRTLKRGILAAAAVAAFGLVASSAQAAVVNLVIDPSASSLALSGEIDAPSIGQAHKAFLPQGVGALTTTYSGSINIDLQPGTIQMLPGSSIVAADSGIWAPAPGPGGPNDDPVGSFGGAGSTSANYGVMIPSFGVQQNYMGLVFDFGVPAQPAIPTGIPSAPVALSGGGTFNLTGQGMAFTAGRQLFVSPLGNDNSSAAGFPTLFGTNGSGVGSWDGTTLVIPVFSTLTYQINASPAINTTVQFSGFITARVVPEPSTILMAGMGVVGLVTVGYRARKRKA